MSGAAIDAVAGHLRHDVVFDDLETRATYKDSVNHELLAQALVTSYYLRYVVSLAHVRDSEQIIDNEHVAVRVVHMEGTKRP